jgi:hypothetical protein
MDIPTEVWIGAAYGALILLVAIGRYLSRPKAVAKVDPVITGVGIELGSREQTERLIADVKRIATFSPTKNTEGINNGRLGRDRRAASGRSVPYATAIMVCHRSICPFHLGICRFIKLAFPLGGGNLPDPSAPAGGFFHLGAPCSLASGTYRAGPEGTFAPN